MTPSTELGATPRTISGGGTNITKTTSFNIVVKSVSPFDKSFSELTDIEVTQLAQALQSGEITSDSLNWSVGDSRSVTLTTYGEQTLVIYHKSGSGIKFTDGTDVNFVIGFKECITNCNYGAGNNYSDSTLKSIENSIYDALPSTLKPAFKQFNAYTAAHGYATSTTAYPVYMCSPAEKEVFGSEALHAVYAESSKLTQFDYYKTANNRKKTGGDNGSWWERSPYYNYGDRACYVGSDGAADGSYVSVYNNYGVSPFGCI